MKNTKTTVLTIISLSLFCANISNAWDETALPADLGNHKGIGSDGYQFATGSSFDADGWYSHVMQSGQDMSASIDLPSNTGEYVSPEGETVIRSQIANWQEYNRDLVIVGGTGYQMGTESGAITLETRPITGIDTLAIASLNTTTTQTMEFNDTPFDGWKTNQGMMSQRFEVTTRDFNPQGDGTTPSVNYDARLEQGYDRTYTSNDLTVHQGGWQANSVIINSTPETAETTVIEF